MMRGLVMSMFKSRAQSFLNRGAVHKEQQQHQQLARKSWALIREGDMIVGHSRRTFSSSNNSGSQQQEGGVGFLLLGGLLGIVGIGGGFYINEYLRWKTIGSGKKKKGKIPDDKESQ